MDSVSQRLGICFVERDSVPKKSPDCSPLDFFGFGYLKSRLMRRRARTIEGVKRAAREEWSAISAEMVQSVYRAWRYRMELMVKNKGDHIENVKAPQ